MGRCPRPGRGLLGPHHTPFPERPVEDREAWHSRAWIEPWSQKGLFCAYPLLCPAWLQNTRCLVPKSVPFLFPTAVAVLVEREREKKAISSPQEREAGGSLKLPC